MSNHAFEYWTERRKNSCPITSKFNFTYIISAKDTNPNGDPDFDNEPRHDDNNIGMITGVCLKRKVRDFVELLFGNTKPYSIYITSGIYLKEQDKLACGKNAKDKTQWMCDTFWDVRTFGATMLSNGLETRTGPVQLSCIGRSVDPIDIRTHTITRCCKTEKSNKNKSTEDVEEVGVAEDKIGTMGRFHTIDYGLYMFHGTVDPSRAEKTGMVEADLELLWYTLTHMYEYDQSSTREGMRSGGLYIFKHKSKFGNTFSHDIQDIVKINKRAGVDRPTDLSDYEVSIGNIPEDIAFTNWLQDYQWPEWLS